MGALVVPTSVETLNPSYSKPDHKSNPPSSPTSTLYPELDSLKAMDFGRVESIHVLNLPYEDISRRYEFGEFLGEGTSGTVRTCTDKRTGELLACKTVRKENADVVDLRREVCAMGLVGGHPAIINLKNVMEDSESVHLITDLATGGDLFSRISELGKYSEKSAAHVGRVLGSALRRCHSRGVVHRDLKPENVLLVGGRGRGSECAVKLADFGHCGIVGEGKEAKLSRCVGTPYYVAPEVLEGSYSFEADIWSLGIILYILLCGEPPFFAEETEGILKAVLTAPLEFTNVAWESVSSSAKDLVSRMLTRDVKQRITLPEMKEHPWIVKHCGFSRTRLSSRRPPNTET